LFVKVQDSGIGIPADKLTTIFESFSQADNSTHRKFGGTGLGLTITKRMINLQGGEIEVQSSPGKGTCFSFTLPFAKGKPMLEEKPTGKEHLREHLVGLKVLLAEDIRMNQFLVERMCKRRQIKLTVANNGQEAIDILQEQTFDLVLMDMHMPVMDGLNATQIIRSSPSPILHPNIPIVGLTADAFADTKEALLQAGMNDFLPKPINMEDFYQTLIQYSPSYLAS
ncbi:MAG: response regulator, partial [Bacteroidota bacterium]